MDVSMDISMDTSMDICTDISISMKHTSHQSMKQVCKNHGKYEIRHIVLVMYLFILVSYFCHTSGFQRVLCTLRLAWDPAWGPLGPWPGPPQGTKDPLEAQSMTEVWNKYGICTTWRIPYLLYIFEY